jgi:hypothetical protein
LKSYSLEKSSFEAPGSPIALAVGQVEWRNLPKAFLQKAKNIKSGQGAGLERSPAAVPPLNANCIPKICRQTPWDCLDFFVTFCIKTKSKDKTWVPKHKPA